MKKDESKERFQNEKIAISVIRPDKNVASSKIQLAVSFMLSLPIATIISININVVSNFREIVSLMNDIFIAFIAMELGAYAIFQALLKAYLVYKLYEQDNLLEKSNSGFLGVILLFWFCIMLNIVLLIILRVMPDDFIIFTEQRVNIICSIILMWIYFTLHFRILFEVRNFAINLYKIFQAHNKITLLEYMDEISNKK